MMATYQKRGTSWRAIVRRQGISESRTFGTKGEAVAWAQRREADIEGGRKGAIPAGKTFGDLLRRYAEEVSTAKKGARWERVRIHALCVGRPDAFPRVLPDPIAGILLTELDERHVAEWRNRRLREVSPASVRREWTLLSNACTVAVDEWRWLSQHPMRQVKRPAATPHRDRLISSDELSRLLHCLGYSTNETPATKTARCGAILLFAIETALRAGEICGLRWADVEMERRFLRTRGKTDAARREVPLSTEALRILSQVAELRDGDSVFQVSTATLDALFRKAKARAGVENLHFHDSRAEAITRLARKMDVLSLARMVGHRDLRMLQVYYRESAEDLAKKLD